MKATVIFKYESSSIRGFLVLYAMFVNGSVVFMNPGRALQIAVDIGETHGWEDPEDCRFIVRLVSGMTIEKLREDLNAYCESIEPVVPLNPPAGMVDRHLEG